jgi:hypothetical protein
MSVEAENRARIFAFHVWTLATAKPGKRFGLSFWGGVNVQVEVDEIGGTPVFKFNGRSVGNVHGAYQAYAEMCAEALTAPVAQ